MTHAEHAEDAESHISLGIVRVTASSWRAQRASASFLLCELPSATSADSA